MRKFRLRYTAYEYGVVVMIVTMLSLIIRYAYLYESVQDRPNFQDRRKLQIRTSTNPNISVSHSTGNFNHNICFIDKEKTDMMKNIDFENQTNEEIREMFNKIIMNPHIGRCRSLKRFGGFYNSECKYWDGHKFMCMDDLQDDIENNKCLIYSFGIGKDYSFERILGRLGCRVHAFDPTVNYQPKLGKNVSFEKLGLAARNDPANMLESLMSILSKHGHNNSKISYLKIDIDGGEVEGLQEWFASGALNNVQQIALEYHLLDTKSTLTFFHAITNLYFEEDFRLISYDLNGCDRARYRAYHKYAEIVLMRNNKQSPCLEYTIH